MSVKSRINVETGQFGKKGTLTQQRLNSRTEDHNINFLNKETIKVNSEL
jgi:hypothetical protein